MENFIDQISLSDEEIVAIEALLAEVTSRHASVEDVDFLADAPLIAHGLPHRLSRFLNHFKQFDAPAGACLISAYPVDDMKIGPTPEHWKSRPKVSPTLAEEVFIILCGALLGDAIGWATQQNGYIIHDVLPIKADEDSQISTGSQQPIWWHNEDAFHPYRGDYVGLFCLRNPTRVSTTLASISQIRLDPEIIKVLFEPRFILRPDNSHLGNNDPDLQTQINSSHHSLESAYEQIHRMNNNPQKISVLFGNPQSPYLRLDPYFMDPPEDEEARYALNMLVDAIDSCLVDIVLQPGDCLFIDNYRAVHGRRPFKARHDGTDRWLKRVNITRDLRKSRDARRTCTSRVIY